MSTFVNWAKVNHMDWYRIGTQDLFAVLRCTRATFSHQQNRGSQSKPLIDMGERTQVLLNPTYLG